MPAARGFMIVNATEKWYDQRNSAKEKRVEF